MCTSIKMQAADESIVFARTMDWHSFIPEALVLPQNYQWKSVYNNRNISNVYTILGVGRNIPDLHADISDGVNDFGLSVQKLTFLTTQNTLNMLMRINYSSRLLNLSLGL